MPSQKVSLTMLLILPSYCQSTELGVDRKQFRPGSFLAKGNFHSYFLGACAKQKEELSVSLSMRSSQSNHNWDQGQLLNLNCCTETGMKRTDLL